MPTPIIDWARFARFRDLDEAAGEQALRSIVEMFLITSEGRVSKLGQAVVDLDVETIRQICHGWRGIAASLGAQMLTQALQECESALEQKPMDEIEVLVDDVCSAYARTRAWLQQHLDLKP